MYSANFTVKIKQIIKEQKDIITLPLFRSFLNVKIISTKAVLGFMLGAILFSTVFGQTVQNTKNTADQGLRSNGRVNPSSLGMEMDIPLGSYPGRGINLPLGLSYSSKQWRFEEHSNISQANGSSSVYVKAKYSENAASGWTSSLSQAYIEYTGEWVRFDDYGRPLSEIQEVGVVGDNYIRRITVYLPGGGSHELRAQDGQIANPNLGQLPPASAWEGNFYATDGSGLKYVQDTTINPAVYKLYMPDGSFYTFNAARENKSTSEPYMQVRRASRLTDINNNFVQFNAISEQYPNGSWTDELGRTFPVMIPRETPTMPVNLSVLEQTFVLPGMSQGYTLRWKKLQGNSAANSGFTDFLTQVLKYAGHTDRGQPPTSYSPSLFADGSPLNVCSNQGSLFVIVETPEKFNPVVLTEIVLPNGASYRFSYNEFGEIERIYYPTGGREEVTYDKVASLAELAKPYQMSNRGVTNRKIFESSSDSTADTWIYTAESSLNNFRTSTIAPDGTQTDRFMHRGLPAPACTARSDTGNATNQYGAHWGYDNPLAGMPYEERMFSSDTPKRLLQRSLTKWTATDTTTVLTPNQLRYVQRNARVLSTESIVYEGDAGLSTATTLEYDTDVNAFGSPMNVVKTKQYGYKVVSRDTTHTPEQLPPTNIIDVGDPTVSNTLLKIAETTYLQSDLSYNQSAYLANNLVKLVTGTKLRKPDNQIVAQTEIKYDETNYGNGYRGQATTVKSWLDPNNIWLEVRSKYDTYGNVIEITDAKENVTTTEYSATYNYAFPTKVTTPVPDSSGINGSQTAFQTTMTYNPVTGLPLTVTDANGQISTMEYEDSLLRPTKSIAPNGHQTITEYGAGISEATRFIKVKTQIDATNWKEGYSWYDGLGRSVKTQSVDSSGDVFALTCYDQYGRVEKVSNPFRNVPNANCQSSLEWTANTYDTVGRVWKTTTPDGAFVETNYGLATSGNQIGTTVTVTDQAGKLRRSVTNGLGQLIRVDEPNISNQLGTISSPNQPTLYSYDTLDNLTTVTQGIQTRNFGYDSLSRLKQAINPEAGTINYNYDNNGNLTSKIDARNITTTYGYDNLNRVKTRSYANEPSGQTPTPNVTYHYDGIYYDAQNILQTATGSVKGKLTSVSSSLSKTNYTAFDILGRITSSQQETDGTTYNPMTYTYNLSGAMLEQTYPSGRVVKTTLDTDGDLAQVESAKTQGGSLKVYASNFTYTAAGAVSSMRLGNGRFESTQFNSRLQPTQIALGSSQNSTNLLKLDYGYGSNDNNGNVQSQTITVQNTAQTAGFTAVQNYTYDSLNRLKQADEKPFGYTQEQCNQNPGLCWKQTFDYDRYGNRNFVEADTTTLPKNCGGLVCPNDIKALNPAISTTDNRITEDQDNDQIKDYDFDAAGNTKKDASGNQFTYDAENKQIKVVNASSQIIGEYFYDGDGKRVKKVAPLNGETTIFIYDASGKMVAEYSTITPTTPQVSYLTQDHLGSPRIITNEIGQVKSRRDFQPFGEEIYSAQRLQGLGYTNDNIRQNFTSYERDSESSLDFAQARMYGYGHGRFTSPDPLAASANSIRPQSWNRYSYSYNNPLRFTDPSGMIAGDFYNLDGDKIGTDGKKDDIIYIVYNEKEAKAIEDTKGDYTTTVNSKITIANKEVIKSIGRAVDRSNKPSADDKEGGSHEEGVSWKTTGSTTTITDAPAGAYVDLTDLTKTKASIGLPRNVDGRAHIHPEDTSGTRGFVQPPSQQDTDVALTTGTNIVVGARSKEVYFFKPTGQNPTNKEKDGECRCVAQMSLKNFLKIGGK